ncbi:MAG: GumC family protein [Nitrospirota bacterium]
MKKQTLLDYWLILYKRKIAIGIVILISCITAIVLSRVIDPVYEAKAIFYVPSSSQAIAYMSDNSVDKLAREKLIPPVKEDDSAPFIGILKSTTIAEYVHNEFPNKTVKKLLLSDIDFKLTDEFMLKIYSRDKDPVLAANVANAYMKYLNLMLQEASLKNPEQDSLLINRQSGETLAGLEAAKNALRAFEEKNNIASVNEEIRSLTDQRVSFQSQLESSTVQLNENEEKMRSLTEQLRREGAVVAENDFVLTNPSIEYLQKTLSDQAAQIAAASVEYRENHPELKMLRSRYNETSGRLKKEVQDLVSSQIKPGGTFYEQLRQNLIGLAIEKSKLQAAVEGNRKVLERISERLGKLPSINTEWTRLNDNIERYKKIYEQLKMNLKEMEMQQARPIQYVVVVDYAQPPENPAYPILWLNVLVSLLFGLCGGVFYALFVDYTETTRKVRTLKLIRTVLAEEKE